MESTLNRSIIKRRIRYKSHRGAIIEENVVALYVLFLLLFLPLLDLAALGLRAFFFWFACEQSAMAGAKGNVWSNAAYPNNSFTVIPTLAKNTANSVLAMFSGIAVTTGPTLTVIAEAIPGTNAATINPYNPTTSTYLDKSLYVPVLQVQMTGQIQPFINVPFLPNIPGLNSPFNITVLSEQQIENPTALSY